MRSKSVFEIQGHRGARARLPENSLAGFIYATELGVNALELDVIVTAEGQVVVSHEPWFNPEICSDDAGNPLHPDSRESLFPLSLDQIQSRPFGHFGHPRFLHQAPLRSFKPTLEQVVKAVSAAHRPPGTPPVHFTIEIKHSECWAGIHNASAPETTAQVLSAIRSLDLAQRTTLQSFSAEVMECVHAWAPHIGTAWLMESPICATEALSLLSFQPNIYSPLHTLLTAEEVKTVRSFGIAVIPWTINDPNRMRELRQWGVNGLITDDPALALSLARGEMPESLSEEDFPVT